MTQTADTKTDAKSEDLHAVVTRMVDRALALRIEEAGEAMDLTPSERVAWIAAVLGLRTSLITECTAKATRLAGEPSAPTVDLQ